MRARVGDGPRTMPQKIFATRSDVPLLEQRSLNVKIDQVVLTRRATRTLSMAVELGLQSAVVETSVSYDGACIPGSTSNAIRSPSVPLPPEALLHGVILGLPGIGFAPAVHLERFASPARLAVTDDPRLCSLGAVGMLALTVPHRVLAEALARGTTELRVPCSIQILLSGKPRAFVNVRDVALQLVAQNLADTVREVGASTKAPVILEFAGPGVRHLSVSDRAVLCSIAPEVGAASALVVGDQRTENFLRDQRRSKAHRIIASDPGAPFEAVRSLDMSTVDPMVLDESGVARPVRELEGKPINQVMIGGDSGLPLKDLLSVAAMLKSKRVARQMEALLVPPSRQMLEVLAATSALQDLIATGFRITEPDRRIITGSLYPPRPQHGGASLRTWMPSPGLVREPSFLVGSPLTLAYAFIKGKLGDPRSFKRPARITVPRSLPTEDVLVTRPRKANLVGLKARAELPSFPPKKQWERPTELEAVHWPPQDFGYHERDLLLIVRDQQDLRRLADAIDVLAPNVRAVVAPYIPAQILTIMAAHAVACLLLQTDDLPNELTEHALVAIPFPSDWREADTVQVEVSGHTYALRWTGTERELGWLRGID